jgi:hypothetical protein
MALLLSVTNKQHTVSSVKKTAKEIDVRMSIEAAFPLTLPFPLFLMGKLCLIYAFFYLRAHFQERNYRVNREVAVRQTVGNAQHNRIR